MKLGYRLGNLGVGGRTKIKWIWGFGVDSSGSGYGHVAGACEYGNYPSSFVRCKMSLRFERLSDSCEGLCSMRFVNFFSYWCDMCHSCVKPSQFSNIWSLDRRWYRRPGNRFVVRCCLLSDLAASHWSRVSASHWRQALHFFVAKQHVSQQTLIERLLCVPIRLVLTYLGKGTCYLRG